MNNYIFKAGNTGKKGGQYRNTNAAKDHVLDPAMKVDALKWLLNTVESQKRSTIRRGGIGLYAVDMFSSAINRFLRYDELPSRMNVYTEAHEKLTNGAEIDAVNKKMLEQMKVNMLRSFVPAPFDIKVYRGSAKLPGPIGSEFTDRGFVSTTLDYQRADYFANRKHGDPTITEFVIPKDTLVGTANMHEEHEIILAPDTRFRIVSEPANYEITREHDGNLSWGKHVKLEIVK